MIGELVNLPEERSRMSLAVKLEHTHAPPRPQSRSANDGHTKPPLEEVTTPHERLHRVHTRQNTGYRE